MNKNENVSISIARDIISVLVIFTTRFLDDVRKRKKDISIEIFLRENKYWSGVFLFRSYRNNKRGEFTTLANGLTI